MSEFAAMIKRMFDIVLGTILIVVLAPLLLGIAILVRSFLGSPVLFRQTRPGLGGVVFSLYKFRSMSTEKDSNGELLPDEQRLSRFGRLLRSTSLDELPSLINVLRGDMSFVGPRPLLIEYLPLYNARQARRHDVRPGITGWAQVNGRNAISWDEKLELDAWYVDNQSFWLDIRILAMTFKRVLLSKDISQPGEATMTKFTGDD